MTIRFVIAAIGIALAAPAHAQEDIVTRALAEAERAVMAVDSLQAQSVRQADRAKDAERDQKEREVERADRQRDQELSLFDQGYNLLDSGRWERAIDTFNRVVA